MLRFGVQTHRQRFDKHLLVLSLSLSPSMADQNVVWERKRHDGVDTNTLNPPLHTRHRNHNSLIGHNNSCFNSCSMQKSVSYIACRRDTFPMATIYHTPPHSEGSRGDDGTANTWPPLLLLLLVFF